MLPLRDENPTRLTPFITLMIIAVNVAVWVYVQGAGLNPSRLVASVCTYGMIPAEVTGAVGGHAGVELAPGATCAFGGLTWQAVLTSMFLHGGWVHLLGNMWFLWLFGNNIEDSMGHARFLVFYLLMGVLAAGAQILAAPTAPVPTVGASGAISGVMGAYLLLYPRVRVETLFIFIIFVRIIAVPAWFILIEWFVLQILANMATPESGGGIAYGAHIGGFIAGLLLISLFRDPRLVATKRRSVLL